MKRQETCSDTWAQRHTWVHSPAALLSTVDLLNIYSENLFYREKQQGRWGARDWLGGERVGWWERPQRGRQPQRAPPAGGESAPPSRQHSSLLTWPGGQRGGTCRSIHRLSHTWLLFIRAWAPKVWEINWFWRGYWYYYYYQLNPTESSTFLFCYHSYSHLEVSYFQTPCEELFRLTSHLLRIILRRSWFGQWHLAWSQRVLIAIKK